MDGLNNNYVDKAKILPVILCGGEGTRLWPLSRKSFPKQFLSLNNLNEKSLLQNTQRRLAGIKDLIEPILICNSAHRFIVAEQMREINVNPKSIILEPFGRNTAPAILLAAFKSLEIEKNPHLLILSSDHQIKNEKNFRDMIEIGKKYSSDDKLVTFGVVPRSPETGYGYIKSDKPFDLENIKGIKISEFIEKPNLKKAKELIKDKSFTWNSGIFLFKAKTIINEIKNLNPEIFKACEKAFCNITKDFDFERVEEKSFEVCPNISIDNAVMEHTKLGIVTQLNSGWSDIGNWKTLWERSNKDHNNNKCIGKTLIKDSNNCYLRSEKRLTVGLGLKNIAVIETSDAVLVADINHLQEVKELVSEMDENNIQESKINSLINRPWGTFTTIEENKNWKVKKIKINSGASISLQLHNHRSEHWVVVSGVANVEIDGIFSEIKENQSIYVPKKCKHRLSNLQKYPLIIIEIQSGTYLGEDDIIRFNDLYGRT